MIVLPDRGDPRSGGSGDTGRPGTGRRARAQPRYRVDPALTRGAVTELDTIQVRSSTNLDQVDLGGYGRLSAVRRATALLCRGYFTSLLWPFDQEAVVWNLMV